MRPIAPILAGLLLIPLCSCTPTQKTESPATNKLLRRTELKPVGDIPEAARERAAALAHAANPQQATALATDLEPFARQSADVADLLASISMRLGAPDIALPFARQAVTVAPTSALLLLHLGQLELQLGYSGAAGEHLNDAAKRAPDATEVHLALAKFKERELHLTEAEQEYRAAVALDPEDPSLLGFLAENLLKQKKYPEARKVLADADKLAPDAPPGLVQRAVIAREEARRGVGTKEEKWAEAASLLEKCLSVAPGYPAALIAQGSLFLDQGKEAEARAALEAVLKDNPNEDSVRVLLGQLLVRQGETERGLELLATHRRYQDHTEALERLVSRVSMQPKDRARRQALIEWCEKNGETARALLEKNELAALTAR